MTLVPIDMKMGEVRVKQAPLAQDGVKRYAAAKKHPRTYGHALPAVTGLLRQQKVIPFPAAVSLQLTAHRTTMKTNTLRHTRVGQTLADEFVDLYAVV
ncbi:hypothetical protein FUAX_51360 (plasmid) [Fulvitalea axinellae]|uniref:Uncharacterized protein n=1 Tax=Fulvitalea axinellae TaxID=1182444 RepID=A0AAU9CL34_9BACT|nr:hypothetical protein FUAX_51360 [Fulvitalea axinellae]